MIALKKKKKHTHYIEELIRRKEIAKEEKNSCTDGQLEPDCSRTQQRPENKNRQGKWRHGSSIYLMEVLEGKNTEKERVEEIIERKCHSNKKKRTPSSDTAKNKTSSANLVVSLECKE